MAICSKTRTALLSVLTAAVLAACGGSGGSSSESQPSTMVGVFGFIPVQGLSYSTATESGVTNANGEFNYQPGERVEFRLGELVLGQADAAAIVTEFDIANVVNVPQNHLQWTAYYDTRTVRSPLTKSVNIASILQTLDTDNDLGNDIQIADQVAALVEANHVDLLQPYWSLRSDRRLRKLVYRASSSAGLTPRPLRTGSFVLQHMFDFEVEVYQTFRADDGADGTIDSAHYNEYAPLGYRAVQTADNDGDGNIDRRQEEERNDNNQRTAYRSDSNNDGTVDYGWIESFDEFGMSVRYESLGPGGAVRSWRAQTWDDEGALLRRERGSADGLSIETWQFVDSILVGYELDSDGDGAINERHVFEGANIHSDWLRRYIDEDLDGVFDRAEYLSYNQVGQIVQHAFDNDNDGTMDVTNNYVLNARGDVIEQTRTNAAGDLIHRVTIDFDENGVRQGQTRDNNGDGVLDWSARYLVGENTLETHFDADGDGASDSSNFYTLNDDGAILLYEADTDADGEIDSVTTYFYEGVRRVRTELDSNVDGEIDRINYFEGWMSVPVTAYL